MGFLGKKRTSSTSTTKAATREADAASKDAASGSSGAVQDSGVKARAIMFGLSKARRNKKLSRKQQIQQQRRDEEKKNVSQERKIEERKPPILCECEDGMEVQLELPPQQLVMDEISQEVHLTGEQKKGEAKFLSNDSLDTRRVVEMVLRDEDDDELHGRESVKRTSSVTYLGEVSVVVSDDENDAVEVKKYDSRKIMAPPLNPNETKSPPTIPMEQASVVTTVTPEKPKVHRDNALLGGQQVPSVVTPASTDSGDQHNHETPVMGNEKRKNGPVTPVDDTPATEYSGESQTPFDQRAIRNPAFVGGEDPTIREHRFCIDDADGAGAVGCASHGFRQVEEDAPKVSKKLLEYFSETANTTCGPLASKIKPTVEKTHKKWVSQLNDTCIPLYVSARDAVVRDGNTNPTSETNIYNESFTVKFLDELLNVGFTLVYYQPSSSRSSPDDEANERDGTFWEGCCVTMTLKPGICNSMESSEPQLALEALGVGKVSEQVQKISLGLLEIHSVDLNDGLIDEDLETRDDSTVVTNMTQEQEEEAAKCFFTITTTSGEIHAFEGITHQESARVVRGIKALTARFCSQVISGDINAVKEFYSNKDESDDIRFTAEEAMLRLSHSFFD